MRNRIWLVVFAVWALLASGLLARWTRAPGVIQALELRGALADREAKLAEVEASAASIQAQADRLESDRGAQEAEVRRVLGYVAADEIVFDFSAPEH